MNTNKTLSLYKKVHLLANILNILQQKREAGEKLPSGRKISTAHIGVVHALLELWSIHYNKSKSPVLRTNRGNLASILYCSERSTYNYLLDFNQLDVLRWDVIQEDNNGWLLIDIHFNLALFEAPVSVEASGEQQTDDFPTKGKICRIHNLFSLENTNNSSEGCAKVEKQAPKIETEQRKKAEQGQQKTDSDAISDIFVDPNFSAEFRAASADERKELTWYAKHLWQQAKTVLWGREFNAAAQMDSIKALILHLLSVANEYKQERKTLVADFCKNPLYQSTQENRKNTMITKFLSKQSLEITKPYKAAFLLLSRAVQIQAENNKKKGYSCYYPTYYLTADNCFEKAVKYAKIEKRTNIVHEKANELRRAHCSAKLKIQGYIAKGIEALRKYGFSYCLQLMRKSYAEFAAWLKGSEVPDTKIYLSRFLSQMACLNLK